jgi:hypothetical protein
VDHELRSGRTTHWWQGDDPRRLPFPAGRDALFIAYYSIAEISTLLALGLPPPLNWLDLFTEFRVATNGFKPEHGNGLLSALECHGLPSMSAGEKEANRRLVMDHTIYTHEQKVRIDAYCEKDTMSLVGLTERMWPGLDLDDALLRGDYMRALAQVEWDGVPMDAPLHGRLSRHWTDLKLSLIAEVDPDYHVFVGTSFVGRLFEIYLRDHGILWPRLPNGALALDKVTFRDMANVYPRLNALHELRNTLAKARLSDLLIGGDGRNRCGLSAFRTITSRNAPRAREYIFGPSRWLRGLIRPEEGQGLVYLDYKSQEIGVAAALADDEAMMADYASGDPYVAFGRRGALLPPDGDEHSHPRVRDVCKTLALGLNYGMSPFGLAQRLRISEIEASDLSSRHQRAYHRFWDYAERVVQTGMQGQDLTSVFGWRRRITAETKPRSLRNWPIQSAGAAMLQLAIVAGVDAGIRIVASIHDAVLITAPLNPLREAADHMASLMIRASEVVTGGFPLRVEMDFVRWPDRFMDRRGAEMWARAMRALRDIEGGIRPGDGRSLMGQVAGEEEGDTSPESLSEFVGEWK